MAKTPTLSEKLPTTKKEIPDVTTSNDVLEGLDVVTQEVVSTETEEEHKQRLEAQDTFARLSTEQLSKVSGPVTLPAAEMVGVREPAPVEVTEEVADQASTYVHRVNAKRRLDDDRVLKGEGPLVDGARYNVVARVEGVDADGKPIFTPLYVTDAMTGERLPTTCAALSITDGRWYGQMHSRIGGSVEAHQGMDPIHLIVLPQ